MDRFWHLHPAPTPAGRGEFVQDLPGAPAGRYRLFADVVHRSGFSETLIGSIELPEIPGTPLAGDDCEGAGRRCRDRPAVLTRSSCPAAAA